jgi:predicted nucleic acid-binding Zn ribbon protein
MEISFEDRIAQRAAQRIAQKYKPRTPKKPVKAENVGVMVLGSVIDKYLTKEEFGAKLKKFSLFNHWPDIVGRDIAKKTVPQKIFKDMLYISVTNATWASELGMMKQQLIDKINGFIGEETIKDLKFKVQ